MTAKIVTVEEITSNSSFWDTNPVFNDTQAQIRNFIRWAYENWGTEYVLLGGDADNGNPIVPVRKLYTNGWEIPSDMYYSCLDGSFNYDGDDKWGEPTDGEGGGDVDLMAEVYVGRACIDNETELANFVRKTLAYDNSQDPYLENVTMAGEYLGFGGVGDWGGNYKDEMINGSNAHGYNTFGIPGGIYNISTLYDKNGIMRKVTVNLSWIDFGSTTQFAFILMADDDGQQEAGYYIDDVNITIDGKSYFYDFENGTQGWSNSSSAEWELGTPVRMDPVYGGVPHGNNCWATDLDDTYENNANLWLYSPTINVSGAKNVTVSYYTWYCVEYRSGNEDDWVWIAARNNTGSWWGYRWTGCNGWSKEELKSIINSGVHIINHLGHANYDYVLKMDIGTRSPSDDIETLTNDKYFFVYSQGCMAGGFDNPNGYDCIAEELTMSEHGAFACIMNARYGYGVSYSTDGASQRYDREFWDAVFDEGMPELGRANADSKEDNLWRINEGVMRWCCYETNLLGDPETAIKIPGPPQKDVGVYSVNEPTGYNCLGSYSINATVKNYGLQAQTFIVNCSIYNSSGSLVYGDNETISNLLSGEKRDVEFDKPWVVTDEGDYAINVTTKLAGDEYGRNDYRNVTVYMYNISDVGVKEINSPTGIQTSGMHVVNATVKNYGTVSFSSISVNCSTYNVSEQIAFFDDMESGQDGWQTYDWSGGTGGDLWHITTNSYHSSSHSWYCGNDSTWTYNDNMWNALISPWINLTDAAAASLDFWMFKSMEQDYDYLYLYVYDNISGYTFIERWTGYADWAKINVDLSQFAGREIQLCFAFYSDAYVTWNGAWIDDIGIKKYVIESLEYYDEETLGISAGEEKYVEFLPWNASYGAYLVNISTSLAADSDTSNDAKTEIIRVLPSMVYVDDDFNTSTPGWGVTNFSKIQDGVDGVYPSGTVCVFNGTYNETVAIDKSVSVIGENKTGTIVDKNYYGGYAFDI
ncbi:hypothetical protein DRQ05_05465, partial [bacterium]